MRDNREQEWNDRNRENYIKGGGGESVSARAAKDRYELDRKKVLS